MRQWIDPKPVSVPTALLQAVGGHPLVAETLVRRGILTAEAATAFLDPSARSPSNPEDLPGLPQAVKRLRRAVQRDEHIAVWGDFDVDGQTSTALLFECLRTLGGQVSYHVPMRDQGHGLRPEAVDHLRHCGADLILTCDTGIGAHDAVATARARGIDVVITDHHLPGSELPPAEAIVNPHFLPEDHPLANLAGVGVAYQLVRALAAEFGNRVVDLVALGTVADVACLTGENRPLVQRGLRDLARRTRLGLRAVYEAADLTAEGLTEEHISFVLAPRMNALGRLADASQGVELLISDDWARVRAIAAEMEGLNARRQLLTQQLTQAVLDQIDANPALAAADALVASHPTWPAAILGIVAGRLADRLNMPVLLLSTPPGRMARGSGRSIPGINLVDALTACSPLLSTYGGHAGAAGLTMEADRVPQLRSALSRVVRELGEHLPEPTLPLDAYVEIPDLALELIRDLGRLAPFGRGNPPLVLGLRDLRIQGCDSIGRAGEHLRLAVEDGHGRSQTVFWWQGAGQPLPEGRFDLAVTARASNFRGVHEVQVEWIEARAREGDPTQVSLRSQVKVHDYRDSATAEVLAQLAEVPSTAIWAEVIQPPIPCPSSRAELQPSKRLVIWTLPPGPQELREVLSTVRPREVYLFGLDPGTDDANVFLRRLAGLAKHLLKAGLHRAELTELAAATAQRTSTVKAGLQVLEALGQVSIRETGEAQWQLEPGSRPVNREALNAAYARMTDSLSETAAYRSFAAAAPASSLIVPLISVQPPGPS